MYEEYNCGEQVKCEEDDSETYSLSYPSYSRFTFTGKTKSRLGRNHSRLNRPATNKDEIKAKEDIKENLDFAATGNFNSNGSNIQAPKTPSMSWLRRETIPSTNHFTPSTDLFKQTSNTRDNQTNVNDSGIDVSTQSNFLLTLKNESMQSSNCKRSLGFSNGPVKSEQIQESNSKELNQVLQSISFPRLSFSCYGKEENKENFTIESRMKKVNINETSSDVCWNKLKKISDSAISQVGTSSGPNVGARNHHSEPHKSVEHALLSVEHCEDESSNTPLDLSSGESLTNKGTFAKRISGETLHKPKDFQNDDVDQKSDGLTKESGLDILSGILPKFLAPTNKTIINEPSRIDKSPSTSTSETICETSLFVPASCKPSVSTEVKIPLSSQSAVSVSSQDSKQVRENRVVNVFKDQKADENLAFSKHLTDKAILQNHAKSSPLVNEVNMSKTEDGQQLQNIPTNLRNQHVYKNNEGILGVLEKCIQKDLVSTDCARNNRLEVCETDSKKTHNKQNSIPYTDDLLVKNDNVTLEQNSSKRLEKKSNSQFHSEGQHIINNQSQQNSVQIMESAPRLLSNKALQPESVNQNSGVENCLNQRQPLLSSQQPTSFKIQEHIPYNEPIKNVQLSNCNQQKTYLAPQQSFHHQVSNSFSHMKSDIPQPVSDRPCFPTSKKPSDNFKMPAPRGLLTRANTELFVNNKVYTTLSMLGRGGSSEVYQVLDSKTSKLLAVKCVDLSMVDKTIAEGYLNEIDLLSKLQGCSSVIKMFDYEFVQEYKMLYVVMEKGDTDLSHLIRDISKTKKISMSMIIYYWTEMLNAVKDIHDRGIIHSDLKPANFLLVSGRLKLIDFGIASSQGDMTSVFKEVTTGTWNYMSPEALKNTSANSKGFKITYKSDVWSLGCILYNLVYGKTPFSHITNTWGKLQAIADPNHQIEFPEVGAPPVLSRALRSCFHRDPKQRPTVAELLSLPYHSTSDTNVIGRQVMSILPPEWWLKVSHLFPEVKSREEQNINPVGSSFK